MYGCLRAITLVCLISAPVHAQVPLRVITPEPIGTTRPDSTHPTPTTVLHLISPKEIACPLPVGSAFTKDGGRVLDGDFVSKPPQLVKAGPREYPTNLEKKGVGGRVVFKFVIDTLGHADPCSFRVLEATNESFEGAAYRIVLGAVFLPAEDAGHRVPVWVKQSISFNP